MRTLSPLALLALLACKPAVDDVEPGVGLLGDHALNPFPMAELVVDGALALDASAFDFGDSVTALPVDRVAWRTGFSPSQTSVVVLDDVDASALPPQSAALTDGSVRLVDLATGARFAVMAELDAWPEAERPALLIRPLQALPIGAEIAVVVLTDAAPRPARFDLLLDDEPPASLVDQAAQTRALVDRLVSLDAARADEIAVAWSFPVGDGTAPMRSVWAQAAPASRWSWSRQRDRDAGDSLAPYAWRVWQGTYTTQQFLRDDRSLDLSIDGSVSPLGDVNAELYVHIPESVADAEPGSVPIMVFGHGIFSQPSLYLDTPDDKSGVNQLAEEGGFIVIASTWRGLTTRDSADALLVANDFGRISELTDRLVQAQANARALVELARDPEFLADPVFAGTHGQSLAAPDQVVYYGISLGSIQGAVLLAGGAPLDAAALHVGGGGWSTMLERSSNWSTFELVLGDRITDPTSRQVAYAVSQLWWDAVDPLSYAEELSKRDMLYQVALGDEQVPNFTSEAFARSVALPSLSPAPSVADLAPVVGPLAAPSRAYVQFDPELAHPAAANRPAPTTGAHDAPRRWSGARAQINHYLRPETRGEIVHFCGEAICAASNLGDTP